MNKTNTQLIPQALVNIDANGEVFTTSLKVAEHFGKNHRHVMRAIRSIIAQYGEMTLGELYELSDLCNGELDVTGQTNFGLASYDDEQGKSRPMYRINHDGFMLLVMGFTGQKAFAVKQSFIVAFNYMSHQLADQQAREANAFYRLRARWQAVVSGTRKKQSRKAIAKAAGYKNVGSVTRVRNRLRDLGIL